MTTASITQPLSPGALNPQQIHNDVQALKKAMKGFGTDEAGLIAVLGRRTIEQTQQIIAGYKSSFGKDLCEYFFFFI